jgi:hypothetical protein
LKFIICGCIDSHFEEKPWGGVGEGGKGKEPWQHKSMHLGGSLVRGDLDKLEKETNHSSTKAHRQLEGEWAKEENGEQSKPM